VLKLRRSQNRRIATYPPLERFRQHLARRLHVKIPLLSPTTQQPTNPKKKNKHNQSQFLSKSRRISAFCSPLYRDQEPDHCLLAAELARLLALREARMQCLQRGRKLMHEFSALANVLVQMHRRVEAGLKCLCSRWRLQHLATVLRVESGVFSGGKSAGLVRNAMERPV
jgi:hypothetical protein